MSFVFEDRPKRWLPKGEVPENDEVPDEEFSDLKAERQLQLHHNFATAELNEAIRKIEETLSMDPHTPGAKLDHGKSRPGLVLGEFCRALEKVSEVGTFGARKYSDSGWLYVENGASRYTDAMLRHYFAEAKGEYADPESGIAHAAHLAWNALARLELMLRDA